MPITLTGTGFTSDYYPSGQPSIGVEVVDPGETVSGVTVENVVVVNSTTITCDFVISQTAHIGLKRVTVSTDGPDSGYVDYRVGFPSDFLVFFG